MQELKRGRQSYATMAWEEAHRALRRAEEQGPLDVEDLERLATCAYMLGREDEYLALKERAYRAHLDADRPLPAARCAFWVGVTFALRGEDGRASGWLGRAERLVEGEGRECLEGGYLLIPRAFAQTAAGDLDGAAATASEAAGIGERFGDRDLFALAAHEQGHILIRTGEVGQGLRLLDEAMLAVTAGELSPIVTGIVYCGVILACQEAFELRRAQEWTAALTSWCDRQPDLVAFTGRCRVHRAEIMQIRGEWNDALEEARVALERSLEGQNPAAAGEAAYLEGEVHRVQGRTAAAEQAYRAASRHGREPQPGLALLRLAEGRAGVAIAAIRRALGEAADPPARARLLPAQVEVALTAGELESARAACEELERSALRHSGGPLEAAAQAARGAVELAAGDAPAALVALRQAWRGWQELDAPYEAARARVLVGQACRALGDEEAARMELEAARETFAKLGASLDAARVDALSGRAAPEVAHGLTSRELEVLRLVARAKSNRAIADQLVISEHTVARHLQNIFAKLGVSSRTAAAAYAFEHDLA